MKPMVIAALGALMVVSRPARAANCGGPMLPACTSWVVGSSSFMDATKLTNYGDPSTPGYTSGGKSDDCDHRSATNYVYRPTGTPLASPTLLVFLHGGGCNTAGNMQDFYQYVASQGTFVIGLDWLNDGEPTQMCTCNSSCYGDLFDQVVGGVDHGFYHLFFDPGAPQAGALSYNSIENRLGLLIAEMEIMDAAHAGDWAGFLRATPTGAPPRADWSKIVIAGHSAGSQVTAWILGHRPVKKALFFSGPKDQLSRSADRQLNYREICGPYIPCFQGPSDDSYTSAPLDCTPTETVPDMFVGWTSAKVAKIRAFTNFFDDNYEPGVTVSAEDPTLATCTEEVSGVCEEWSNGWEAWNGGSQSALLQFELGVGSETRIQNLSSSTCNSTGWGPWVTVTDVTHEPHNSTIEDATAYLWDGVSRECIWGHMLNH